MTTEPDQPDHDEPDPEQQDHVEVDGDTFPRSYVEQLRAENARYRQRAARADEATERLLSTAVAAAADVLADPADLLTFGDRDDLLDDEGWPDPHKIADAAARLAETRPHLATRRPGGNIGQGATAPGDDTNLAAMLRARA